MKGPCGPGPTNFQGDLYEIKMQPDDGFPIEVCYNMFYHHTIYTRHFIRKSDLPESGMASQKGESEVSSCDWNDAGLYPDVVDADYCYRMDTQNITLDLLLQPINNIERYMGYKGDQRYLARGHLTPNADFKDAGHRKATYYFINAAPQWQFFNNGEWLQLERAVRQELRQSNRAETEVFTGSYGVLQLQNDASQYKKTWLGLKNAYLGQPVTPKPPTTQPYQKIPVPKTFWKCVELPQPVLYQSINDPRPPRQQQQQPEEFDMDCINECDVKNKRTISWIPEHLQNGTIHCCYINVSCREYARYQK